MEMPKLMFHRIFYQKYNTSKITIMGALLKLEDYEILQKEETKYCYQKAVVKLYPEKVIVMKEFEEKVNEHLQDERLSHITLVYGNRVYLKIKIDNPKTIKLKGVWINIEKKPFPQLWLELSYTIIISI